MSASLQWQGKLGVSASGGQAQRRYNANNMIILKEFLNRIVHASSRAFIGKDENDELWVVRPKLKDYSAKRLFNEYYSRKLGEEFQISRPSVELIKIDIDISDNFDEVIDYESPGVATKFLEDINNIETPPNSKCTDDNFAEVNIKYLTQIFGGDYDFEEFYAYRIYSAWICLEDYAEYGNLHKNNSSNKPVFIDFDFSFKGAKWSSLPNEYLYFQMESCAFFLDGVITDLSRFEKYYEIIKHIDRSKYESIFNSLPEKWNIPTQFKSNLMNLLFEQRESFLSEFSNIYEE